MNRSKSFLRNRYILKRKNRQKLVKKFNFNLLFTLIKKHFNKKKIIIAGYYPSSYEVNILKFLEEASKKNFRIVLPVIKSSKSMIFKKWVYKDPLHINNFGILEPANSKKIGYPNLILVPLVAFDNKLNRIGYGKGYYDRSLKKIKNINKNALSVGIAYSFQRANRIPVDKHDFKLDYIFTERGIISSK